MIYEWNSGKNEWLKKERGISFEKIIFYLEQGHCWKVAGHYNRKKYPEQSVYLVVIDGHIYVVPYKKEEDTIFLKTIIPSRKYTRLYKNA
ncbi:MAG: toxin [Kiritimatiellae bacterium]|nr:toxin [Kiritimatiellia bacterium]